MSAAGLKRPGLECPYCHEAFALSFAQPNVQKPADLPDKFPATCPICGEAATYQRSDIGILAAVGPR